MSDSYYISENQLHTNVAMFLDLSLPNGALWQHSMNEGKRGAVYQAKLKSHGVRAGWPDIQVVYEGRSYFIELKRPASPGRRKGELTTAQKSMHAQLLDAGAQVAVCYSLGDVQDFLISHIPLKARAA